ncbi:glycosyltransferase family 2 protein [Paenarthrobacter sp. NPDC090517]|uniref:glycosyltransferase family 2 protein n=1 Tax=Paenarthrobacter sp. NPDC090517 TaxID=3364381 RepID=UPI0037F43EC2
MTTMHPPPLETPIKVTVVVSAFNDGHRLEDTVASALSQEGVDVDVILVDDASTDGTDRLVSCLVAGDERITAVFHTVHWGRIATWNDGLSRATGRYVTIVAPGECLALGSLARAARLMESNPRVGMVHGRFGHFTGPQTSHGSRPRARWSVWAGTVWLRLACARGRSIIPSSAVMMRMEAVLHTGAFNSALTNSATLEFWLRMAATWDVGEIKGPLQAHYGELYANHLLLSSEPTENLKDQLAAFRVLEGSAVAIPVEVRLRHLRRAEQALSEEALRLARHEISQGGLNAATELRRFIEALHTVPGNIHKANALQADILRASRRERTIVSHSAAASGRQRLTAARLRLRRFTEAVN